MTPEEYAELNGAYPDAPNNPTPSTTGFMDDGGFSWAGKNAECSCGHRKIKMHDKRDKGGRWTKHHAETCEHYSADNEEEIFKHKNQIIAKKMRDAPACESCGNLKTYTPTEYNRYTCWPCKDDPSWGAEIEDVSEDMAIITNKNDEMVGAIEVVDDKDDDELVEVSIQDDELNEIGSHLLDDGVIIPSDWQDDNTDHLYEMYAEEPIVEYPDWIPAGDGNIVGQQNSAINMSPLHAESFNADFGKPTDGDFTTMQVTIGSPSGSTGSWYNSFEVKCVGEEENLSYLTSDIEDVVVDRVKRWNGDEVSYNTDTVGTPSPTFNEDITGQDGPETEPTNSNFSAESGISWGKLFIGSAALILGGGLLANKQGWVGNADDDIEPIEDIPPPSEAADTLVENPDTGDLLTGDYEEMVVQSTGYAVPVIPMSLDGSFMGSRFHALPTDRYVDYNEPGIGAHTDVAMYANKDYLVPAEDLVRMDSENCECSIIDKILSWFNLGDCGCEKSEAETFESQGIGQSPYFQMGKEPIDMDYRVIKEVSPKGLDPAAVEYMPTDWVGQTGQAYVPSSLYGTMYDLGVAGIYPKFNSVEGKTGANRAGDRMAQPNSLENVKGPLSVGTNSSYTDGSTTKSLAQWGIENQVSQISDSEAVVISHTSGERKMIRRV